MVNNSSQFILVISGTQLKADIFSKYLEYIKTKEFDVSGQEVAAYHRLTGKRVRVYQARYFKVCLQWEGIEKYFMYYVFHVPFL